MKVSVAEMRVGECVRVGETSQGSISLCVININCLLVISD